MHKPTIFIIVSFSIYSYSHVLLDFGKDVQALSSRRMQCCWTDGRRQYSH
jgi:hypothetical protein